MDSVSNGSMQSSSASDEEYDSRADAISAFVTNQPYQLPHYHAHSFDSLSNYLDLQRSSSSLANPDALLNLDMTPSKPLIRSDPYHGFSPLIPSSSSCQNTTLFQSQMETDQTGGTCSAAYSTRRHALLPMEGDSSRSSFSVSASIEQRRNSRITVDDNNVARNLKKRSRASRRAPTTVLTTDTANFRAMVQEFTGIPAPPFTSTHFPRSRLHFIGTASSSQPVPSYLTRPFVQKVMPLPPPFVTSSSPAMPSLPTSAILVDSLVTNTTSSATHSNSVNCHLSSDYGLLKQASRNLLNVNMHTNPILSFQYSLETSPEFRLAASSPIGIRGSRPQGQGSMHVNHLSAADPNLELGGELEQFGLGQGHMNTNQIGLQAMVNSSSSSVIPLSGSGINNPTSTLGNARVIDHGDGEPALILRSSLGDNLSNSCNVNCSASSSDFHKEKRPDGVPTARTEGMVESWINCSSD